MKKLLLHGLCMMAICGLQAAESDKSKVKTAAETIKGTADAAQMPLGNPKGYNYAGAGNRNEENKMCLKPTNKFDESAAKHDQRYDDAGATRADYLKSDKAGVLVGDRILAKESKQIADDQTAGTRQRSTAGAAGVVFDAKSNAALERALKDSGVPKEKWEDRKKEFDRQFVDPKVNKK